MAEFTGQEPVIGDPADPGGNPGGGGGGAGSNIGVPIYRFTFLKSQAESILKVLAYASLDSPDDLQLTGYLSVAGIVRQATPVDLTLDNRGSRGKMPITMPAFITGLPIGGHEIVFSIRNNEADGALTVRAGAYIEATEIKRAAL